MPLFSKSTYLNDFLSQLKIAHSTIGFVPTMGALHDGHLSLIKKSLQENTLTVVSIFVNPTQFNNPLDLEKYPRTLEKDLEKIANPDVIIYAPNVEDVYTNGVLTTKHFDFDGLENQMEGASRPGHFNGVGTVVKRLFDIVKPTKAYFGEKDFQQLQIIKKLVFKNSMPLKIIGCPILREENGLAMSSRNALLSPKNRDEASIIFKTLKTAKTIFLERSIEETLVFVSETFSQLTNFRLDYFQIANETTLEPCFEKKATEKYRAFIAVFIENVRLIDNIAL